MTSQKALAEGDIIPASININGTATRMNWQPVWLEAVHKYAILLLRNDADAAMRVAELYQVVVLLSSRNASTWTYHQNRDLTYRLLGARFTANTRIIDLGTIAGNNTSDLIELTNFERVASGTDLYFTVTKQDDTEHKLSDDLPMVFVLESQVL